MVEGVIWIILLLARFSVRVGLGVVVSCFIGGYFRRVIGRGVGVVGVLLFRAVRVFVSCE